MGNFDEPNWKISVNAVNTTNSPNSARTCAAEIATLPLDESANFVTLRRRVRDALAASTVALEANKLVIALLST